MTKYILGKVVGEKGDKGDKGEQGNEGRIGNTGNGIESILLLNTSGRVKTYRIRYTNGAYFDFNVTDGVYMEVANNLTTTDEGKVLDARQGKALADLIGDAITYINQ